MQDCKSNLLRVITTKPTVHADFFHQGQTLLCRLLVGRGLLLLDEAPRNKGLNFLLVFSISVLSKLELHISR